MHLSTVNLLASFLMFVSNFISGLPGNTAYNAKITLPEFLISPILYLFR